MAQTRPVPLKYKRRTPIQDRVYKSSPVMVQSKFPRLKQMVRTATSTPSSSEHQATLTQMDFGTPRQFAIDAEIPNSDDEGDEIDEPPPKRARTRAAVRERISSTPGSTIQSTLTQMDWALMGQGILDSDEEDEEGDGAELPSIHDEHIVRSVFLTVPKAQMEDISSEPLPGSRGPPFEEPSDKIIVPGSDQSVPETPRRSRDETIPSSQTPSATPISIPGSRHRTTRAELVAAAAASPTPSSTRRSPELIHTPSRSRRSLPNKLHHSGRTTPTPKSRNLASSLMPPTMAPPALPLRHESPLKEKSQNIVPQIPVEWLRTQSQTQTTPRTKQKVMDFNSKWALLTGNPNDMPNKNWTPKSKGGQASHMPVHASFSIGDSTQAAMLQIEMENVLSGPDVEETQSEQTKANANVQRSGTRGKVIVIQSSQDDECHQGSSQLTEPEEDDDGEYGTTEIQNESLVPASSPIVPGFAHITRSGLYVGPFSHIVPDTQNHVSGSELPVLGAIRSSQASTTAGTPHSPDVNVTPTGRIPATSPGNARGQAPPPMLDSLPMFGNTSPQRDFPGTSPTRVITVSQLIPSSLLESVPRPQQDEFETQAEFMGLYDDEEEDRQENDGEEEL
jgi:hypothetical protein